MRECPDRSAAVVSCRRAASQPAGRAFTRGRIARVWAVVKARRLRPRPGARDRRPSATPTGWRCSNSTARSACGTLGWTRPLLMLEGAFEPQDLQTAGRLGLTLAVHHRDQLAWLGACRGRAAASTYLKFNTGMNRLGFARADVADVHRVADPVGGRRVGHADDPLRQLPTCPVAPMRRSTRFESATAGLPGERSLSNSAALIGASGGDAGARVRGDWVRPGIMLYGATPYRRPGRGNPGAAARDDAALAADLDPAAGCRRRGRLRLGLRRHRADAHRHCRLRLRRRVSAPCAPPARRSRSTGCARGPSGGCRWT